MNRIRRLGAAALAIVLALSSSATVLSQAKDRPAVKSPAWENEAAAGGGYLAWQKNSRGRRHHYDLFLRKPSGRVVKVNRPGTQGGLGSIDGGTLVYQEWRKEATPYARGAFSRIVLYDLKTGRRTMPAAVNGASWEHWPTISGPWIFYAVLDSSGNRHLYAFNRKTKAREYVAGAHVEYLQPGRAEGGVVAWVSQSLGQRRTRAYVMDMEGRGYWELRSSRWQWAPTVGPQGAVYVLETGRQCGSSPVIKRYARTAEDGYSTGKVVLRLPEGVDSSWSSAYADARGLAAVVHQRLRCGTRWGSDIYRFSDTARLTVGTDGSGDGTVAGPGIDCGEDCAEVVSGGTWVTLTAEPGLASHLEGWSGCTPSSDDPNQCRVRVDDATTVTATFELGP
ncbi:MAG TPA: hypothetical protein VHN37_04380 [Actinomycetota bacterium]|nr:hypothetical protein [Actinomycetota bacterium]